MILEVIFGGVVVDVTNEQSGCHRLYFCCRDAARAGVVGSISQSVGNDTEWGQTTYFALRLWVRTSIISIARRKTSELCRKGTCAGRARCPSAPPHDATLLRRGRLWLRCRRWNPKLVAQSHLDLRTCSARS